MSLLKPGDILTYSWGYDQTNVDFLLVTKATDKTVVVQEIEATITEIRDGAMQGTSVPVQPPKPLDHTKHMGETMKSFLGGPCLDMDYGVAVPWDGKPQSTTWYA